MRISDWSSDVCSSDLSWHQTSSLGQHGKLISPKKIARWETARNNRKQQDTREADGTIFGTLARFFRIANSTPKGAQPTPADGVIAMPVSERIIDRTSVGEGKSVLVSVDVGGPGKIKKTNKKNIS